MKLLRNARGGTSARARPIATERGSAPEPASQTPPISTSKPAGRARAAWQQVARENWRALSAGVMLVLGVVLVILGWWGAARTNIFTEQIPYLISGGLLGLGLIIVAGFLAYAASSERTGRELRRDVAFMVQNMRVASDGGTPARQAATTATSVLTVPGGHSYHVAGCPIVEGKDGLREMTVAGAIGEGLVACKLCGPS